MTARQRTRVDDLPGQFSLAAKEEIARFAERVTGEASCLVTGSLVEGLGNAHSDVDFYVMQPDHARTRPVSIGIRGARYVDCEYLSVGGVAELAEQFTDPTPEALLTRTAREFSRYYRIAIGIPLVVTEAAEAVLAGYSTSLACARFAEWCGWRAYQYAARAAVAGALGLSRHAELLLREGALWRASKVLAEAGEGYPSLKWTETKAARHFGPGSAAYRDCLDGYLAPAGELPERLARLRERIDAPTRVLAVLDRTGWALADGVRVVADGEVQHLLRGRASVARSTGLVRLVTAGLSQGQSWSAVTGSVARELGVPRAEVLAATHDPLRDLAEAGYLTAASRTEDVHVDR